MAQPQKGDILGERYKLINPISRGGFGTTFLVEDLRLAHRFCVVKHLSPRNLDPEAIKRAKELFQREAEYLSKHLQHEQIPHIYDFFSENGEFYLVQEYIQGHDLSSEFNEGEQWTEAETTDFLRELLEILAFVHQKNIIHRDIKPANIMRRDRDGKLFLIDFGAVRESVTVDARGNTAHTDLIGTVPYMAPEQAMGNPKKSSDLYAVGMVGIQAITGLTANNLPCDLEQLEQILAERQIEISSQLLYFFSKTISFQAQKRFTDASEALEALESTRIARKPCNKEYSKTIPVRIDNRQTKNSTKKFALFGAMFGAIALIGASGVYALQFLLARPNYAQLETYLKEQQWEKADLESDRLLLEIAREDNALNAQSIANFPCKALQKINHLWTEYSKDRRFGFTPQKQIYLKTGNQINGRYIESKYQEFGNKVGWRTFGTWSLYGDLKTEPTDIAPEGHLPSPGKMATDDSNLRWQERGRLLKRFNECGL